MADAGDIIGLGLAGGLAIGTMGMMAQFAGPRAAEASKPHLSRPFVNSFLDGWWQVHPKSYNEYLDDYFGDGRDMVEALRDDNPARYQKILNVI